MKMGGIEIYRNIYIKEQQWINRLMDVEFRGRDILLKQFSKAKIIYKQEYAFISLKFKIEGEIEPYPYLVRVPVEMRERFKLQQHQLYFCYMLLMEL